jgi:protein-S-isoprenylcysteine O-methyltransferase Ste14
VRKLELISFVLLALLLSLVLVWLSVSYTFSLAFPLSSLPHRAIDWGFVALNVVLFSLFVLFIRFRKKIARLPSSIYLAFIVALFAEMYGFPLTMYTLTWLFGSTSPGCLWYPLAVLTGEELFTSVFLGFILPASNLIIMMGILLIVFGWQKIYGAKGKLVTTGIYGHVRHPQYLGFMLLTLGMNILWIAISSLLLWPVLAVLYYRLAREEDKELEERFGEEYRTYERDVPMLVPRMRRRRS